MVMPLAVLEKSMNKRITLLLKDTRIIDGKLVGYDEFMNLVLVDVQETFNENVKKFSTIILRGSTIVSITPSEL
jgi:small nuclear ribonucleoprotein